MTAGLKTVIYPVQDLGQAKALYSGLLGGVEPVMDQAYYVQFNVDGTEIGPDHHGHNKGQSRSPVSRVVRRRPSDRPE